jgi:glycosyltransferase involved in cell wall biosynthesis
MKAGVSEDMDLDVVVCAKNRAGTLEQILRQIKHEIPYKDLIVIYGASDDETEEIAKKYTDKVFWDEDRGLGAARNLGVRKASSELVAMIDSDVILTTGWHKRLMKHVGDPKVAAAMGTTIYGYGLLPIQRLWEYWQRTTPVKWGCTNTIFKRDCVLKVGNFDEAIRGAGEDYDLYKRILAAGYKWVQDREVVVYHPMNLSEYLNHTYWWEEAIPLMRDLAVQVRTYSLFKIYCRLAYQLLKSVEKGVRLSRIVDPRMLFYVPMLEAISFGARLKGLKKTLSSYCSPRVR